MLQQDGATAVTAIDLVLCLQSYFGNRVTSRELWTHNSSYLITSDFCVCEMLMEKVNINNSRTEIDRKLNIQNKEFSVSSAEL
jgi:hypothetical protein